jgi:hypothetical protein
MEKSSEVLVLVAGENNATILANHDGVTRHLRSVNRMVPRNDNREDGESRARHIFACELMMMLGADASRKNYDGVIIFAEASMMEELRLVQTSAISRLLIAQIVGKPSEHCRFPGRSAANAELAYRGAVH